MNKDKLLEVKKMVMYEIGLAVEKSANKQIDFGKQMAIVGVLGDLTANIDANFDDIIQTEPDETKGVEIDAFKNNFAVITESPERLAEYFYDVNKLYAESLGMNMKQSKEDGVAEFIKWLNEKAGE
jgi:hypothetical protein